MLKIKIYRIEFEAKTLEKRHIELELENYELQKINKNLTSENNELSFLKANNIELHQRKIYLENSVNILKGQLNQCINATPKSAPSNSFGLCINFVTNADSTNYRKFEEIVKIAKRRTNCEFVPIRFENQNCKLLNADNDDDDDTFSPE